MTFFEEFKAMCKDPEQREVLKAYFEGCEQEPTKDLQEIRVAVICPYTVFINLAYLPGTKASIDRNEIKVGYKMTLVNGQNENDVYGRKFDYFILYNIPGGRIAQCYYDACAYLVAHNVDKINLIALETLMQNRSSLQIASNEQQ